MRYNPNLPQYAFGDWLDNNKWFSAVPIVGAAATGINKLNEMTDNGLQKNAGAIGTAVGAAGGMALVGPAGAMAGGALGGAVGGAVQSDYEGGVMESEQLRQMNQMKSAQSYQNRLQLGQQQLQSQQMNQNQFAGTQNFEKGGGLPSTARLDKMNYFQNFPQTSAEGDPYYITRRTTETQNNPAFVPFTDNYMAFSDSTLIPDYGNMRGFGFDDNKIAFSSDGGDSAKFKEAFYKKISIADLGLPKKEFGGDLEKYSGQSHQGPNGGIAVDENGSPTSVTNNNPVGLVEDGEVSWNDPETGGTYIFSKKLTI